MESIKKQINKKQIGIWLISMLPVLIVAILYNKLPEQIPTNWGMNNQVTYGPKSTIWLIAGMSPLFGILFFFLPMIDPKRRNYLKFMDVYQEFQLFMQVFLMAVTGIIVVESIRPGTIHVSTVITAMCGLLFLFLGSMMPKFQQNFFCGFKTPWTLSSEEVWNKTNRMGGRMIMAAGILSFLGAFLPDERWKMAIMVVSLAAAVLVPGVMSYVWFQKEQGEC